MTNKRGYTDKKLCRINSIVGVADGYYRDNFRTNTKGRIKKFIIVPDEMFNGDTSGLIEFFARYLNTISLDISTINAWVENKASSEQYPVHDVTLGADWDVFEMGEKKINIFPFTRHAIVYLYRKQDSMQRNPRAIMRDLIEPYVKDAIESLDKYPVRRTTLEGVDPKLQNKIYNRSDLEDDTKIRLSQFMYIWGNGTDEIYEENNIRYIAGIAEPVYKELGLPIIDGSVIEKPVKRIQPEKLQLDKVEKTTESKPVTKENEQVAIALKEVDKWIENKDYNTYTDKEKDILGKFSSSLFTLNTFYTANKLILGRDVRTDSEKFLLSYWTLVVENMRPWQELQKHEITKVDLRENYIATQSIVIQAFGRIGNYFYEQPNEDMEVFMSRISGINWVRNAKHWKMRAIGKNGRVITNKKAGVLICNVIKDVIGITLTNEEKNAEDNYRKSLKE